MIGPACLPVCDVLTVEHGLLRCFACGREFSGGPHDGAWDARYLQARGVVSKAQADTAVARARMVRRARSAIERGRRAEAG